ncbi:MAG: hypothetical protein ACXWUG_02200 [Polyangiales bacterium]
MRRLAIACVLWSGSALAYHTEDQRIVTDTAYTLKKRTVDLGVFRQMWGPWDRFTVGTYAIPWAVGFANVDFKWRCYGGDPLALSARVGFVRFKPKTIAGGAGTADIGIIPFELLGSYRFGERFTVSSGFVYTVVTLQGSYDPAKLQGAAAVTNMQYLATLEYRLSRVTAFVLSYRYLVFQVASGHASSTLHPDPYTTIELETMGHTNDLNFPRAYSIVPSVVLSWETFNLRFGVGYGNYSVPMVNLVLPHKTVVPDLELSWLF